MPIFCSFHVTTKTHINSKLIFFYKWHTFYITLPRHQRHFPTTTTTITTTTTESIKRVLRDYHARINALEEEKFDLEYVVKRKDFEVATALQKPTTNNNKPNNNNYKTTFVDLFSPLTSLSLSLFSLSTLRSLSFLSCASHRKRSFATSLFLSLSRSQNAYCSLVAYSLSLSITFWLFGALPLTFRCFFFCYIEYICLFICLIV